MKIESLKNSGLFSDVKLLVGNREITAHKLLLASSVPYFYSMFSHDLIERKQDVIKIKDMDPEAVETIINFVYTSKIIVSQKNVQSLLHVATILQVKLIQDKCCEFLEKQLDPANCLGIYAFSESHGCLNLKEKSKYYCNRHFCEVVKEEEFLCLPFERVRWFLDQNDLCVRSETEVFNAAISWIQHNFTERRDKIPQLLPHVRLQLLSQTFLTSQLKSNHVISNDLHSIKLLSAALKDVQEGCVSVEKRMPAGNTVIFCMGGYNKKSFASHEYLNPDTRDWIRLGTMPKPKSGAGAVFVGGLLYLVGGRTNSSCEKLESITSVETYDPFSNKWSNIAKLSATRHRLGITALDGVIYAVGGSNGTVCLSTVEKYDAENDIWNPVASMSARRMGVGVAVLEGLLYAVGGFDAENRLRTAECYCPITDKWKNIAPMNTTRSGAGVVALNGHVYALGGYNGVAQLNSVERYCPLEDKWTMITPMNEHRSALSVAIVSNKIYALGGYNGEKFLDSVEVYEPESGEWQVIESMPEARSGAGVAVGVMPVI